MQIPRSENMIKGWFVGNFEPNVLESKGVEVGVKEYQKSDYEQKHHRKVATEITTIIRGRIKTNGIECQRDDIIVIEPDEANDFEALEGTISVAVRMSCVLDGKYLGKTK